MKKSTPDQIQSIVDDIFPHLAAGEITLEAILAEHPQQAEELRACLESAIWLHSHRAKLEPHPGYLAAEKHTVLALTKLKQPATVWQQLWRPHSPQRYAIQILSMALLLISLVLVLNSLRLASRLALPGDWLYPAKLVQERIQLVLAFDPQQRASLQIERTQHRTTEIVQLVLEDELSYLPDAASRLDGQIQQAMTDLEIAQAEDAYQAQVLLSSMTGLLEKERFILSILRDMEPATAHLGLNQAISATTAGLAALNN
jgi:hypothetical protein